MTGIAAVARATDSRFARAAEAAALGELVADKLPNIPNRTDPGPLLGRAIAGAIVGAAVGDRLDRDRVRYALAGAAIAVLTAQLSFRLRRTLSDHLPPVAAALAEDVLVVAAATAGASALR